VVLLECVRCLVVRGAMMAEAVARLLRDGVVVGEQAPAVMLCDSLQTRAAPALFTHFFASLTSNIAAGRAQAKSVVVVSLTFCVVVVAVLF
jgi:hypothetical protein